MKCPNCGFSFDCRNICPKCGVDIIIFQKTKLSSLRLYNRGLESANEQHLCSAIVTLEQSLLFDKNNIESRNLLGLLYYEVGHIGDALKHWIISSSIKKNDNVAFSYMESLQKNARLIDKMNDAILYYNKALIYLQQDNTDLAMIQLKRAIDFNKNFIDAHNLLTLCYIQAKQLNLAQSHIQKVLHIDCQNEIALSYAQTTHLSVGKKGKQKKEAFEEASVCKPSKRIRSNKASTTKTGIISFFVGAISASVVLFVLVFPGLQEIAVQAEHDAEAQTVSSSKSAPLTADDIEKLQKEVLSLREDNQQYKTAEELQTNLDALETATVLMDEENYEEASVVLSSIDPSAFQEENLKSYQTMKSSAYPQAASSYYNKGKSDFLNNEYATAEKQLNNALKYVNEEDYIDDAIYYLGKIAESKSDSATAEEQYQTIITKYPDSNQLANAKNALAQLKKTP